MDPAAINQLVPKVREAFMKKYNGSILDDTYDERDVEWVKTDDRFVRSALECFKAGCNVDKACDVLNESLLFRAKYKVNDLNESNVNAWYKERSPIYFHGKDKMGHKVMIFDVSKAKKGHLLEEGKAYIAWKLNEVYKQDPEDQCALLYDFANAGISNMDLDLAQFMVTCNGLYFPNYSAYAIMFKMGTALEALWKIIQSFMDSDQRSKIRMCTKKNLQEHIAADQLLDRMVK